MVASSNPRQGPQREAPVMPVSGLMVGDGPAIHYLQWQARGRPVLILHGMAHAGGVYAPLAFRLSSSFRVVTVDHRGYGLSDKPIDYSWQSMCGDIVRLIRHLRLEHVLVVAHSRGAGIAMLVAAALPEQVSGMVVFEPSMPLQWLYPTMNQSAGDEWVKKRVAQTVGRRRTFPSREAARSHYEGRGAFKGWKDEYLAAFVTHCLVDVDGGCELASPEHVEGGLVRARLGVDGWSAARPSDIPVLAMFGEYSGRLDGNVDYMSAIRRLFPNARKSVMPAASHCGPMEFPDLFEASIREFEHSLPPFRLVLGTEPPKNH